MTPPRPILELLWALHKGVRRISGGRLGTSAIRGDGLATLFLHTTGRKSGKPRVNGLFYIRDGPDLVVVASNAGAATDPAWCLNLRERPDAEVEIAGRREAVEAREADVEEVDRLWPRLVTANPDYAKYRAKARRPIPVFILARRRPRA